MEKCYETMQVLLSAIKYANYNWEICGDLKVIGILMGMQSGFTKYCCFFMPMGQLYNYQVLCAIRVAFVKII